MLLGCRKGYKSIGACGYERERGEKQSWGPKELDSLSPTDNETHNYQLNRYGNSTYTQQLGKEKTQITHISTETFGTSRMN